MCNMGVNNIGWKHYAKQRGQSQEYPWCDFIHMKCPQQENLQRQEAGYSCLGLGGEGNFQ